MEYHYEITHEDERFVYGKTFRRDRPGDPFQFASEFMQTKTTPWFVGRPEGVLARIGIQTDARRAREFADIANGNLQAFHYMSQAFTAPSMGEEALKWAMGPLMAVLNERGLPFERANSVLPADYLAAFIEYLTLGAFDRSFAKDIFQDLIRAEQFEWEQVGWRFLETMPDDNERDATDLPWGEWVERGADMDLSIGEEVRPIRRLTGFEVLNTIKALPSYQVAGGSEIDTIIEEVIAANPENAAKVQAQPKLVQWFVGQVMKAAKGKAPAPVVTDKLKARFGVE